MADAAPIERTTRELGRGAAGPGRLVDVAGVVALTDPGPAAAGVVVADERGRMLAHRAHFLGTASLAEATAQALLGAARLARDGGLEAPVFRIDDPALGAATGAGGDGRGARNASASGTVPSGQSGATGPALESGLLRTLREALAQLPGHRVDVIPAAANRARAVALTPLIDWLPERTRRAEGLQVRPMGDGRYEVESESEPGRVYHVTLRDAPTGNDGGVRRAGEDELIACECADFLYRNIPCKHLFAVAREVGALDRLFAAPAPARPQQG